MPNPGPRYSICGASYFNDVFGEGGELELTHGYTGGAVLTHNKTTYNEEEDYTYVDASNGDHGFRRRDGCHPKWGGREKMSGYECVWSLPDLFVPLVECGATNSSFCQALNREDCEFTPNTCGRCFECYTPDDPNDQHHACSPMQAGLPLPAPTLQTTGAVNSIGPAGLSATSLRVRFLGLGWGGSVVALACERRAHPESAPPTQTLLPRTPTLLPSTPTLPSSNPTLPPPTPTLTPRTPTLPPLPPAPPPRCASPRQTVSR